MEILHRLDVLLQAKGDVQRLLPSTLRYTDTLLNPKSMDGRRRFSFFSPVSLTSVLAFLQIISTFTKKISTSTDFHEIRILLPSLMFKAFSKAQGKRVNGARGKAKIFIHLHIYLRGSDIWLLQFNHPRMLSSVQ